MNALVTAAIMGAVLSEADIRKATEIVRRLGEDLKLPSARTASPPRARRRRFRR